MHVESEEKLTPIDNVVNCRIFPKSSVRRVRYINHGSAVAQRISRRLATAAARIRAQVK
jgi:hypothetical protein